MEPLCTFGSLDHKTGHTCEHGQGHPFSPSFFLLRWSEISAGLFFTLKKIQVSVIFFKSKGILDCLDLVWRCQLKYE